MGGNDHPVGSGTSQSNNNTKRCSYCRMPRGMKRAPSLCSVARSTHRKDKRYLVSLREQNISGKEKKKTPSGQGYSSQALHPRTPQLEPSNPERLHRKQEQNFFCFFCLRRGGKSDHSCLTLNPLAVLA
jgi:hypothetical protein